MDGSGQGPQFTIVGAPAQGDEEVLEAGAGRRVRPRWQRPTLVLAGACLLAGVLVGYLAGHRQARTTSARVAPVASSTPTSAAAADGPALVQSASQCSVRSGRTLQLGVQVLNHSAVPVLLRRVEVDLPLRGLKPVAQSWGPCGLLPSQVEANDNRVPAGAGAWFTVTFQIQTDCPAPLPVQFTVAYTQLGQPVTVGLPGFADLGGVPYVSCPTG